MKTNFVDGVSKERVAAIRNSPRVAKFIELTKKVTSGTATVSERAEYDARTQRVRNLDPRVLVD